MKAMKWMAGILAVLLLAGCGQQQGGTAEPPEQTEGADVPDYGGTLNLYAYAPDTLNPLVTGYRCNSEMLGLIYEGLFCVEQDFSVTPVLATGYTADDANRVYTIQLKNGVRFHNGDTFDAEDVVSTINCIRRYQTAYTGVLANVQRCYAQGSSVVFELNQPRENFVNLLDFPILPDTVQAKDFSAQNTSFVPVGTGKYKYDHEVAYKRLMLTWNDSWHNAAAGDKGIDQVRISYVKNKETGVSSFDAGELDVLTSSVFAWGKHSLTRKVQVTEHTNNCYSFVGVNHRIVALADSGVRRAINRAIDKNRLVNDVMFAHGVAADAPINPEAYYFDAQSQTPRYDTEEAKAILAEAGWLDLNGDGVLEKMIDGTQHALRFTLLYNQENTMRQTMSEYLQTTLSAIGVSVTPEPVPFEGYQGRIAAGQYDLFLGQMALFNDGSLDFFLGSGGAQNVFGYNGSDGDLVVIQRAKTADQLVAAYLRLQTDLARQMPVIGLFYGTDALLQGTRVTGDIRPSRTGPFSEMLGLHFAK